MKTYKILTQDTQYAIATQRNMCQPDHAGDGHVAWLTDDETGGGYRQDPITCWHD